MNQRKFYLFLATLLLALNVFAAIPNNDNPRSFLGPYFRLGYADSINLNSGYAVFGEAGTRNWRLNGTLGFRNNEGYQRFKLSGELLRQTITYPFYSGNSEQAVNQGALGAAYQYNFLDTIMLPALDVSGYFSMAPSTTLRTVTGTNPSFTDNRRIAGSSAAGGTAGLSIRPWLGGLFGVDVDYDSVRYDTVHVSNKDAKGFGGGLTFRQFLLDKVDVGLATDWRRPFNSFTADMQLFNLTAYDNVHIDLNYTYVRGKNSLPSTYNIGLGVTFIPDQPVSYTNARYARQPSHQKGVKYKDHVRYKDAFKDYAPVWDEPREDFMTWLSRPAVYMPQVLAIPDGNGGQCTAPVVSGTVPDFIRVTPPTTLTFDVSPYFTGENLTYTLNNSDANNTINATTGVITSTAAINNLTVTASNSCGSVTSNVFDIIPSA